MPYPFGPFEVPFFALDFYAVFAACLDLTASAGMKAIRLQFYRKVCVRSISAANSFLSGRAVRYFEAITLF
jgi:hypothetical protein